MGNLFLVISAILVLAQFKLTSSKIPGGDYGMGYGLMLFFYGIGFVLFSGFLALNLGMGGKFNWLDISWKNTALFLGWLSFAVAIFCMGIFRAEWHPGEFPNVLGWLAHHAALLWLAFLVLGPCFWLVNFGQEGQMPPFYVHWPLKIGIALSLFISLGALYGQMRSSAKQAAAVQEYNQERDQEFKKGQLEFIASQTLQDNIVNILSSTGRFNDPALRNAALEKIKSHPDWEADLIRLLNETEMQAEVYHFLDGNAVEHPELFVEPIKTSLRRTAADIRGRITDANNLQDWHMESMAMDRILRAIDEQFSKVPGADFRAEVRAVRDALNTPRPERFRNVKFTTLREVEEWLKRHP